MKNQEMMTDSTTEARHQRVLELLGPRRFFSAFEPGCSIGELTVLLAPRCEHLLATDLSRVAVERAQRRLAPYPHVDVRHAKLATTTAEGPFDLLAFCEIGYYFDLCDLTTIVDKLVDCMALGGLVVATHWTGDSADHTLSGQRVHDALRSHPALMANVDDREADYLYGLWERL